MLGGAGWFLYASFIRNDSPLSPVESADSPLPQEQTSIVPPPVSVPEVGPSTPVNDEDSKLLFGEPVDSDGDGLTNDREAQIGTDPSDWDTDSDELSDYDEVAFWKTDPLNPDTDGDNYPDGVGAKKWL